MTSGILVSVYGMHFYSNMACSEW